MMKPASNYFRFKIILSFLLLVFVCSYSQVHAIRILFCPSPSKGHYNPFMTVVKQLLQFNAKDANGNNLYEMHVAMPWIENVSKPSEWIQQDFTQDTFQIIDQPRNSPKNQSKSVFFYKYGEWKKDFLKLKLLETVDMFASFSIESFNFFMERYENYPDEKPDIIIVDSLDIHYSSFDLFQQLNFKFNNSVRLMTLLTTIGEAMDLEDFPLTHPNSISELIWGTLTNYILGKFEYFQEYFQWFKIRVWKYSIVSILLNAFTAHVLFPILRILFHLFALIKIRPHYHSNFITKPFSNRFYNSVSTQYPVLLMAAPGVLESIRMRPYPKYFDIGFPLAVTFNIQTDQKLIQNYLDEMHSKGEELIFISTGSFFKLKIETNRNIIRGLSQLLKSNKKLNVLMRIEKEQYEILQKEVTENRLDYVQPLNEQDSAWTKRLNLSTEFLPQQFILNHPATRLFVTHCGYNSVAEGLFYGKLLIGIPISADQFLVCNRLQDKDFGDWTYSNSITPQSFSNLLETTLNSQSRRDRIQWASSLLQYYSSNSGERIHNAIDFTFQYFNGMKGFDEGDDGMKLPLEWTNWILLTTCLQIGIFLICMRRVLSKCLSWFTCCCSCCCKRRKIKSE